MAYTFKTIACPVAWVTQVNEVLAALDASQKMFTAPYSATGLAPATHYVCSGAIAKSLIALVTSPTDLYNALVAVNFTKYSQAQITNVLSKLNQSALLGKAAIVAAGLKPVLDMTKP